LQLSGEPYHHQAHIADDGQQHLAQRLGLAGLEAQFGTPIGRQSELAQLAQATRQVSRVGAEALFGGFPIQELGVEERLEHGRDHHIVVGIERADDFRDIQGGAQYVRAGVGQIEGACRREGGAQPLARRDRG